MKFICKWEGEDFLVQECCLVGEFESFVIGILCSVLIRDFIGYYIVVVLKKKIVVLWRKIGEVFVILVKDYFVECIF